MWDRQNRPLPLEWITIVQSRLAVDPPRPQLTETAKERKIKGHTKMTQWGLAAAIAKLDDSDEIILGLIICDRHYQSVEEDLKYLQSLRF